MNRFAINGNWIEDMAHPFRTQALQFGAGLFETVRVQNGEPHLWRAHMDRLQKSARTLGLDQGLDGERLEEWTLRLLEESGMDRGVLKLLWTPSENGGTAAFQFSPLGYSREHREAGFRVRLGSIRRNPFSRVVRHKTCNYLDSLLERQAAREEGCGEALLLNTRDEVAEGTATNVFALIQGRLVTPPEACGLLPGVLRSAVLEAAPRIGIEAVEDCLTLEDLAGAEGLYLTNSLMGFMPVSYFMGNCYDIKGPLVTGMNSAIGLID